MREGNFANKSVKKLLNNQHSYPGIFGGDGVNYTFHSRMSRTEAMSG